MTIGTQGPPLAMTVPPLRDWRDWDAAGLVELKRRAGTRISVVVPARDEAATVGHVVGELHRDLVERSPLVDELVVIDSDSTDDTAAVARAAGARVHAAADVLPRLRSWPGKGEALWKSLFVTSGDLLCFVDADLVEWGTHFVTGLLGPLLTDPAVQLVKGAYRRPGAADPDGAAGAEGGRVTELVARPLIARRRPGLAGVVQPLAGEWAVRRTAFERFHVPVGYGVELAALIDSYDRFGIEGLAQVDLGRRAHTHQPLRELGAMALELLALTDRRAGIDRGPATSLPLQQFGGWAGDEPPVVRQVHVAERPPAIGVPGYASRP